MSGKSGENVPHGSGTDQAEAGAQQKDSSYYPEDLYSRTKERICTYAGQYHHLFEAPRFFTTQPIMEKLNAGGSRLEETTKTTLKNIRDRFGGTSKTATEEEPSQK